MGDSVHFSSSGNNSRAITSKNLSKRCLLASTQRNFSQKTSKCIASMKQSTLESGAAGDVGLFLLKTGALYVVRRFSKANCPFVWSGLQALQILCYPPFKWIQKWAPFKGLIKYMQTLSKPLLALTIATVFADLTFSREALGRSDSSQAHSESESGTSAHSSTQDTRSSSELSKAPASEKWLLQLYKELGKQSISLPERLNEDELRRFYAAANGDFSKLLSSVKKTVRWRQTYVMFSPEELQVWSQLVYWHGRDLRLRPCLIVRLGLACSNLRSNDRSLFVKAVVSQIEQGVMHLVDVENLQVTVLMDCKGLSPFGFPMQMMRSCAILLQDHYPNRLGSLVIIRLPPFARVITQTLFQVLRPATRQKLKIIGDNYQKVLSECLPTLPSLLGGNCTCPICSDHVDAQGSTNEEIVQTSPIGDSLNDADLPSRVISSHAETCLNRNTDQVVKTAIVGILVFWILVAFFLVIHHPEYLYLLYQQGAL